ARGELHHHASVTKGDLQLAAVDHLPELLGQRAPCRDALLRLFVLLPQLRELGARRIELLEDRRLRVLIFAASLLADAQRVLARMLRGAHLLDAPSRLLLRVPSVDAGSDATADAECGQ